MSVTADKDTVQGQVPHPILRRCLYHRIQDGSTGNGIYDPDTLGHHLPDRIFHRPSRHAFRDTIQKCDLARFICANHSVANAFERDLGTFLLNELEFFDFLSLSRIEESTRQHARLDLALD
jgi:hypothetical protein